jgi:hypothetical protein
MKLIVLLDGNNQVFEQMTGLVNEKDTLIVNTEQCEEFREVKYLLNIINDFSCSGSLIMLGKFSGNENVIRELGDERPELIFGISTNTSSSFYSENPISTFSSLINIAEKETKNKRQR